MTYVDHQENSARRRFADFPDTKKGKLLAGTILGALSPKRRKRIAADPFKSDCGALDRAIRNGLYAEAFKRGDHQTLRKFLSHYWAKPLRFTATGTSDSSECS